MILSQIFNCVQLTQRQEDTTVILQFLFKVNWRSLCAPFPGPQSHVMFKGF